MKIFSRTGRYCFDKFCRCVRVWSTREANERTVTPKTKKIFLRFFLNSIFNHLILTYIGA